MITIDSSTEAYRRLRQLPDPTDTPDEEKSHGEHIDDALRHERALRWSVASRSWALARVAHERDKGRRRRRRAAGSGDGRASKSVAAPKPGTTLEHRVRGTVTATCVYVGEGNWAYAGASYKSATAAANAAAKDLGLGRIKGGGLVFWDLRQQQCLETRTARWGGSRR